MRQDYASASQAVYYTMAGIMALAFLISARTLRRGVQTERITDEDDAEQPGPPAPADAGPVNPRPAR